MAQPVLRNISLNVDSVRRLARRNIMEAVSSACLVGYGLAMPVGAVGALDAMFEMIDTLMAGAGLPVEAGPVISTVEPVALSEG